MSLPVARRPHCLLLFRNRYPDHKEIPALFRPSPYQTSLERLVPYFV
jgi:hypothetical protein